MNAPSLLRLPAALLAGLFAFFVPRAVRAGQPGFTVLSDVPPKSKFSSEFLSALGATGHTAQEEATRKALAAVGHEGTVATFLRDSSTDSEDVALACKISERLLQDYAVVIHRASGKGAILHAVLVRASPCSVVLEKELGPGDDAHLARALAKDIAVAVKGSASEAPAEEPANVEEPVTNAPAVVSEPPAQPLPPVEPAEHRASLVALEIGPRFGLRDFSYTDLGSRDLLEYGAKAPSLSLRAHVEAFPFAREKHEGRFFGLGGEATYSLGGSVLTEGPAGGAGTELSATYATFTAFAAVRVPVSPKIAVGGRVGYGHTSFTFDVPVSEPRLAPSSTYAQLRIGPRVEARFGAILLHGEFDYLHVFDGGTAANRFLSPSIFGLELQVGAGYQLTEKIAITGQLTGTRFASSFEGKAPRLASGATDLFATFDLGLRFFF